MGRTTPTATMVIQYEEAAWSSYRKALKKEEQDIFDKLFHSAKLHLPSISFQAHPIPFESILLSILIEQEKKIIHLEGELRDWGKV